jgi:hypothetical protein
MYSVEITSTAHAAAATCKLLDVTVGSVGGFVGPIVMRLAPKATDYVSIDLNKLICMRGQATVTLDVQLQQGQSVRASFTGKAENNAWAKVPEGWTGTVTSGTFRRQRIKKPARNSLSQSSR